MKNKLALDLSTTCMGYSLFNDKEELITGYKLFDGEDHLGRGKQLKEYLTGIFEQYKTIDTVIIEERLQAFSGGRTSTDTILKLAQFNFLGQWICQEDFKCKVITLGVQTARKQAYPHIKLNRKGVDYKKLFLEENTKKYGKDWIPMDTLSRKTVRGNAGDKVQSKYALDTSDSLILLTAFVNMENNKKNEAK